MAFEGLNEKLQAVIRKLNGKGKLSEAAIKYFGSDISQDPQSN